MAEDQRVALAADSMGFSRFHVVMAATAGAHQKSLRLLVELADTTGAMLCAVQRRLVVTRRGRSSPVRASGTTGAASEALAMETDVSGAVRADLERTYFDILQDAAPGGGLDPDLAAEFAARLADFTDVWGKNFPDHPERIDAGERELRTWIGQHQPTKRVHPIHVSAAR